MKVAVIGANGQLGQDAVKAFVDLNDQVSQLTHHEVELSNLRSVSDCLKRIEPDLVVNAAAMHHVEKCEADPVTAHAINAIGSRNLAQITRDLNAVLVHISTDYVFDGKKAQPYVETDAAAPLNAYGMTKLEGERVIQEINPRHFLLRTAALYGAHPCRAKGGQNFVDLMLRLARERGRVRVVDNEYTTPTATLDLARQIGVLSRTEAFGLYHATAEGSCSWYEFAQEIFAVSDVHVKLEAAASNEFPAKVPRPAYSVLENEGLKTQNLNVFRPWQAALREYLQQKEEGILTPSQASN